LFSDDTEIRGDLSTFYYFKIPELKTLWENNKELESSLRAGEFSPLSSRSQLINSFATKAEVIISGLKLIDKVYEEEFIFPFALKPKFNESADSKSYYRFDNINTEMNKYAKKSESKKETGEKEATQDDKKVKESENSTLPWNIGKQFYDKKVDQPSPEDFKTTGRKDLQEKSGTISKQTLKGTEDSDKKIDAEEALDAAIEDSDIDEEISKFKEFQPVRSRLSSDGTHKENTEEQSRLSSNKKSTPAPKDTTSKPTQKFTEVKSKTEVYHLRGEIEKLKKKNKIIDDKLAGTSDNIPKYKSYRENRNLFPILILFFIVIIAGAVIYFYLIKEDSSGPKSIKIVNNVTPPADVNIIDRDFEFAVTYPYPKTDKVIPVEGINPKVFSTEQVPPPKEEPVKPIKPTVEPVVEKKVEVKPEEKPKVEPGVTEQKSSRIFLYNNYYVVFIGSYSSYAAADRAAEKYFNEGYNAFIEVEDVPGKPTRYNLNVGDFTSEEFARQFQEKNIK
jgi:cell division septation protein DedD